MLMEEKCNKKMSVIVISTSLFQKTTSKKEQLNTFWKDKHVYQLIVRLDCVNQEGFVLSLGN